MQTKNTVLLILDGWGHNEDATHNAIAHAATPVFDNLIQTCPHTYIKASGTAVGLPAGQMGNSEVGHTTIGAGRTIEQDLSAINKAIACGKLETNSTIQAALNYANQNKVNIHLIGLVSAGGVHAHEEHILALSTLLKNNTKQKLNLHAILDGRDTAPKSALLSLNKFSHIEIASICGRFYAMDRDKRQERTDAAFMLMTAGQGRQASSAQKALNQAYALDETDEFVSPTKIINTPNIQANDVLIFMNFRADRARQLSYKLTNYIQGYFASLMQYAPDLINPVIFVKPNLENTLGEYLAKLNYHQLRIAETEKYAHVTYFFNGGKDIQFANEHRLLIPSAKVNTYDEKPDMSAREITKELIKAIKTKKHKLIVCNFANADMVGHTGINQAAQAAVSTIDNCLQEICTVVAKTGDNLIITSDHGNADLMWDELNQQPHTRHTNNLVPFIYYGNAKFKIKAGNFSLQDVAPSILTILNIKIPLQMQGTSILESY